MRGGGARVRETVCLPLILQVLGPLPFARIQHAWCFVRSSETCVVKEPGGTMHTSVPDTVIYPALVQPFESSRLPLVRALFAGAAFGIGVLQGTTAVAQVSASPTSLNWVSVPVGGKGAQKVVTLKNSGTAAITISSPTFTGSNPGDFLIFSTTCGASLAASSSCTANIIFGPKATGARSATLNFNDSASNTPQRVVLTGTGTTSSGSASVTPTSLNWVSVPVGGRGAQKIVTLKNNGTISISISSIGFAGTNPGDFLVFSKTCGTTLAASATCTANIVFAPTATGARSAILRFTDSASNSPQTVTLTGGGATGFTITPQNPTVAVNGTLQFTSSVAATWAASCGTIGSTTGLYKAPATASSCKVTAAATNGSGQTASTTVTVTTSTNQVTITPSKATLHALGQMQFTTNQGVTWSASCGTISSTGLFTAPVPAPPAFATTCAIKATSTVNSANTATVSAVVTVVNYTTRKNGNSGTGVQTNELALTPASVSSGKFVQRWSAALDAAIWGQPLYLNGVTIGGKARNAVFVTTANDSVYALDADTGSLLWKTSFLSPGVTAVAGTSLQISSQIGILSTPVIDPVKQVMYVVAVTSENNATTFPHRLHALSILTGKEMLGGPVLISDPALPPVQKFQRPGLLLANGRIYVAFGSIEDRNPYHGLIFAFDENTLEVVAFFNVTPTGSQGGIWMSGASPTADKDGNIYVSTGNGSVSANNFGQAIVKLSPNLQELDFFIPHEYVTLNQSDIDLGSGSVMVVPDQAGPYPHELIACGKPTPIYVINRDAMGEVGATSDKIIQRLDHQLGSTGSFRDSGQPCYNSPAMWQQNVYFAANHDVLKMFVLNASTGMLSATPISKGTFTYQWPGADPVVSSNGNTNGIVWTLDRVTGTLHASDAMDVSKTLYTSPSLGAPIRWVPPMVANGHVYVTASGKIIAYGLTP